MSEKLRSNYKEMCAKKGNHLRYDTQDWKFQGICPKITCQSRGQDHVSAAIINSSLVEKPEGSFCTFKEKTMVQDFCSNQKVLFKAYNSNACREK